MSEICPVCNSPLDSAEGTCSNCGYRFLGATQSFKPVDISQQVVASVPAKPVSTASLRVIRGPQIETIFDLKEDILRVGRSPQCEIFLNDMTVSREHAQVIATNGGHEIIDSNSYNGVWVNNESVERRFLQDGDIVQVGVFCLLYKENK